MCINHVVSTLRYRDAQERSFVRCVITPTQTYLESSRSIPNSIPNVVPRLLMRVKETTPAGEKTDQAMPGRCPLASAVGHMPLASAHSRCLGVGTDVTVRRAKFKMQRPREAAASKLASQRASQRASMRASKYVAEVTIEAGGRRAQLQRPAAPGVPRTEQVSSHMAHLL